MRSDLVRPACEKSLADWKMAYFDLYLIHWPFAFKSNSQGSTLYDDKGVAVLDDQVRLEDAWRAMEELVLAGLAKNIGVSNFSASLLKRILAIPNLRVSPAVNQVELHPYLPQAGLLSFCHDEDIICEAYSSLGSGEEPSLLEDDVILEVAKNEGIRPSCVLLSWARQLNILVIPKSGNPGRIAQNFLHRQISPDSMTKINSIQKRHRFVDPMTFWGHQMPQ